MNSIIAVEDHMLEQAVKVLGTKIKLDSLPAALNLGLLKQIIPTAPAVYFAFLGGRVGTQDTDGATINGRFDAYVLIRHVGNDDARRRGDSTTVGAYEVIRRLIPALHDSVVDDVGRIQLKSVQNLFSIQLEQSFKCAMYAITFEVPNMPFNYEADLGSLDDFMTFDAQYDIPVHEAAAEHDKWVEEPADYTTSEPDLTDNLTDLNT